MGANLGKKVREKSTIKKFYPQLIHSLKRLKLPNWKRQFKAFLVTPYLPAVSIRSSIRAPLK
jgi:hypothetical protein